MLLRPRQTEFVDRALAALRARGMRMLTVELGPECLERLVAEGWLNAEEARDVAKVAARKRESLALANRFYRETYLQP